MCIIDTLSFVHFHCCVHCSSEAVKTNLDAYITNARAMIQNDENLCLLCVQCFEVYCVI